MDAWKATYDYGGSERPQTAIVVLPSQDAGPDEFVEELGKALPEIMVDKVNFRLVGLEYLGPVFPTDLVRKSEMHGFSTGPPS